MGTTHRDHCVQRKNHIRHEMPPFYVSVDNHCCDASKLVSQQHINKAVVHNSDIIITLTTSNKVNIQLYKIYLKKCVL